MDAGSADGPGPRPDGASAQPVERLFRRWRTIRGDPEGTSGGRFTTWPPTGANLKELTAPIPNGFREVSG